MLVPCNYPNKPMGIQLLSSSLLWLRKSRPREVNSLSQGHTGRAGLSPGALFLCGREIQLQNACCPSPLWAGVRFFQLGRPRQILLAYVWLQASRKSWPGDGVPGPSLALLFLQGRRLLATCRFSAEASRLPCQHILARHHSSFSPSVPSSKGPERTHRRLLAWWPTAFLFSS